jgi:hypothetical protein
MKTLILCILLAGLASAQAPPASSVPTEKTQTAPSRGNFKQAGHQADLAYSNSTCTSTNPCNLHIYRTQCDNATTCASYIYSPQSFVTLNMSTVQNVVTSTGTTWTYSDTDPNLLDNTTYSWVSVAAYKANPTMASGPSTPFQGTIPALAQTIPVAPTTGACRIVK